jgi:hypothetical protein
MVRNTWDYRVSLRQLSNILNNPDVSKTGYVSVRAKYFDENTDMKFMAELGRKC